MLDGDHYRTAELVNQLMNNAISKSILDLIEALKPKLYIEAGKYHYQLADAHIDVSGDTLYEAMVNFQSAFYNQKVDTLCKHNIVEETTVLICSHCDKVL